MSTYRRPPVRIGTYTDADGEVVPYGSVYWGDVEPASEVYSVCTHPERFEPVVVVGEALLEHLVTTYDVERTDEGDGTVRRVTLRPRGGGATVVMSLDRGSVPHVALTAGHRFEELWPDCGCDACDDDVPDLLDHLEVTVLSIVEGHLSEWREVPANDGRTPWKVCHRLGGRADSGGASWGHGDPFPAELPDEPHPWPAWPTRS